MAWRAFLSLAITRPPNGNSSESSNLTVSSYIAFDQRASVGALRTLITPNYTIAVSAPIKTSPTRPLPFSERANLYGEERESAGFAIPEPTVERETVTVRSLLKLNWIGKVDSCLNVGKVDSCLI